VKKQNLPAGRNILIMKLSGPGSEPVTVTLNNLSDKNTELTIPSLQPGKWQCGITIKDTIGNILFAGVKELSIVGNISLKMYLYLYTEIKKTGTIYYYITYGNDLAKEDISNKNINDSSGHWIDYNKNPILSREDNPSIPFGIRGSKIIFDSGIYKMWYFCIYSQGVGSIWYAESKDGLNWKTIGSSPVLSKGEPGAWDDYSISVSAVLKENNLYKMYYLGYHKENNLVYLYVNDVWHTGLATSTDGIHWTKNTNPVIYGTGYVNMNITDIVKKENIYYAYFGYSLTQSTDNKTRIGVATSSDGINWDLHKIMSPTLKWEGSSVTSPTVILDEGVFKMIYVNNEGNSFGYATSTDGINFKRNEKPIFISNNSTRNNSKLMSPNFRKIYNIYWLYYGITSISGDMEICLARNFQKNFE
jgi:sucrose-6-phosphate hydrolase SacC (GH32 family)